MDIALYIVDLLHQHQEVNVPGLGTFFKKRVNGFYDEQKNMFIPPSQSLAFKLEQNENLMLADYCCAQRNISQETAIYFIEKFTKAVWEQLNTADLADLKALGTLRKENNDYILEAPKGTVYDRTYYGLEAVAEITKNHDNPSHTRSDFNYSTPTPPSSEEPFFFRAYQEKTTLEPMPAPVAPTSRPETKPIELINHPTPHHSEAQSSVVVEAEDIHHEKKQRPIVEALLSFVSLLLLAAIGIYFFYPDVYKHLVTLVSYEKPITRSTQKQPSITIDSTLKTTTDTLPKKEIIAEQENTAPTNAETNPIPSEETTYEIIIATFGKQSEAEKYIIQLKEKGIQAKIVPNPYGPRIRISCASFTDKLAAEAELTRIKAEVNPDAWLAIIKPHKPEIKK